MSVLRLVAAAIFLATSGLLVATLPHVERYALMQFEEGEPYFKAPVQLLAQSLVIRRDSNGKGYFGAPRDGGRKHQGLDFLAAVGDPVFASKSGRVIQASWQKGYGGVVKIRHPDGRLSVYAHLSRVATAQGDWVERGGMIGLIGKSGNAQDHRILPHLHFEIRLQDKPVNPGRGLMDPSIRFSNI